MTADEVLLKKKPDKPNPLYPDADGKAKLYPLSEVKIWDSLRKKSRIKPFVKFEDLNNGPDTGYNNRPKPAVVFGISFDF